MFFYLLCPNCVSPHIVLTRDYASNHMLRAAVLTTVCNAFFAMHCLLELWFRETPNPEIQETPNVGKIIVGYLCFWETHLWKDGQSITDQTSQISIKKCQFLQTCYELVLCKNSMRNFSSDVHTDSQSRKHPKSYYFVNCLNKTHITKTLMCSQTSCSNLFLTN